MTLRVVVYAEGPGEDSGIITALPPPSDLLEAEHCGAIHRLVERCVEGIRAEAVVQFFSPLRTKEGNLARGSRLRQRPRDLRRLLTWADPRKQPDLAIVVVDQDGEASVAKRLGDELVGIDVPWVIAAPAPEFESWLLADLETARDLLGVDLSQPPEPESMQPGEAKRLFSEWMARTERRAESAGDRRSTRQDFKMEYADRCDLSILHKVRSFEEFERDLRNRLPPTVA